MWRGHRPGHPGPPAGGAPERLLTGNVVRSPSELHARLGNRLQRRARSEDAVKLLATGAATLDQAQSAPATDRT